MNGNNKPKVFVTQIPHRRDHQTGAFVPSINITPAGEHGEIVVMMPERASFHATADLVRQMRDALKDYDFDGGDCVVALGDPAIIAVVFAILGREFGKFTVLKWDKNTGRYIPARVQV